MGTTGLLLLSLLAASAFAQEEPSEECRPKPPSRGKEQAVCCQLPEPIPRDVEKFKEIHEDCKNQVVAAYPDVAPPQRGPQNRPKPPSGDAPSGPPPESMNKRRIFMTCMDVCLFNKTGLLMTSDYKLNEDAITKIFLENLPSDSPWKSGVATIVKACAAKEYNSKQDQECNTTPAEFMRCLYREAYLNCPETLWDNSETCNEEKSLLKKCPNLIPRPRPHGPPQRNRN